jgi:anhydro-N-acetylmuramic acid kinase
MLARQGKVNEAVLQKCLSHSFFAAKPPKSLDRNQWDISVCRHLDAADGAATLSAFTVHGVARALDHLPEPPCAWYVTGGGRHNPMLMEGLRKILDTKVQPVDDLGWNGDAIEAEGFAYLAVRSLLGLPLSLPTTTGITHPLTGGVLYEWKNHIGE